jgi:hypothetical protein
MSPDTQRRYNTGTYCWSLYWADRNGRWHRYVASDLGREALKEIEADLTCIF